MLVTVSKRYVFIVKIQNAANALVELADPVTYY